MKWYRLRFRLMGNFHVGQRKWGYVRSSRSYLPGWTLWGALTAFLVQSGRTKDYHETGVLLHKSFWFSHLFLTCPTSSNNELSSYLPFYDEACGTTSYCWQNENNKLGKKPDIPVHPSLQPGIVRTSGTDFSSQGNLFLTETISAGMSTGLCFEGWVGVLENKPFPLQKNDGLLIGGNRSTNGCELFFDKIEASDSPPPHARCHLSLPPDNCNLNTQGDMEKIVLRRTRDRNGKRHGFGGCFEDWGLNLAPGWQMEQTDLEITPKIDTDGWLYHGVVSYSNTFNGNKKRSGISARQLTDRN